MPPSAPSTPLSPTGNLSVVRPEVVLRFCEEVRFSGTLAFQDGARRGVLPMLDGGPELDPANIALEAALDEFLALTEGRYILTQMLPPLEGATAEGELTVRGSLERVTVSELLRYSEGAGLTGTLTLRHDDRTCAARYQRGELASLTVDNQEDAELSNVFAWSSGTFEVRARSVFDEGRASSEPHDRLMQTLEVALTKILEKSAQGAAQARGEGAAVNPLRGPSMIRGSTLPFGLEGPSSTEGMPAPGPVRKPSEPKLAAVRRSVAPPPGPDTTVKVYFVDKGASDRPSTTRHAAVKLGAEALPLADDSAKLDAVRDEASASASASAPRSADSTSGFGALGKSVSPLGAPKIASAVSLAATAKPATTPPRPAVTPSATAPKPAVTPSTATPPRPAVTPSATTSSAATPKPAATPSTATPSTALPSTPAVTPAPLASPPSPAAPLTPPPAAYPAVTPAPSTPPPALASETPAFAPETPAPAAPAPASETPALAPASVPPPATPTPAPSVPPPAAPAPSVPPAAPIAAPAPSPALTAVLALVLLACAAAAVSSLVALLR